MNSIKTMTYRGGSLLALGATLALAGCYPYYQRIVPESGQRYAYATEADVTLYAKADAWRADPYDLPRHLTPIWVEIRNHGKKPLTVSYADFSLADEHNFRFAAISPYSGRPSKPPPAARAPRKGPAEPAKPEDMDPRADPPPEPSEQESERGASPGPLSLEQRPQAPLLLAAIGPLPVAAPAPTVARPDRRVARRVRREAPSARSRGPRYSGRRYYGRGYRGSGFYVYPRAGLHLRYYDPWPGVVYYPPNYGVYVYSWGPHYYPVPPSNDVRELGLPEGVVQPGGRVAGFIYFHRASQQARRLTLAWHARTPAGKRVTELSVAFAVLHDY